MNRPDLLLGLLAGPDALSHRAQAEMQQGQEIPVPSPETKLALEQAGLHFGEPGRRRGFVRVVLPRGWTVRATNHRLYSHIHDERGRIRAQIMYDGQDGQSWLALRSRFRADYVIDDYNDRSSPSIPAILDSDGNALWRGTAVPPENRADPQWAFKPSASDVAREIARKKLDGLAPDWRSPIAYWGADGDAISWPPNETPPDSRETYLLLTRCYRSGSYQDGGEHASYKATSDAEARQKLIDSAGGLSSYYDEVHWTIKAGDRIVEQGTIRQPRQERRRSFYDQPDYDPWTRPWERD